MLILCYLGICSPDILKALYSVSISSSVYSRMLAVLSPLGGTGRLIKAAATYCWGACVRGIIRGRCIWGGSRSNHAEESVKYVELLLLFHLFFVHSSQVYWLARQTFIFTFSLNPLLQQENGRLFLPQFLFLFPESRDTEQVSWRNYGKGRNWTLHLLLIKQC